MGEEIQFIDLKTQQDKIRREVDQRIKAVLDHGQYIMGPEVIELEECLSKFVGVKHTVSCASGTDALLMALMAYGVGPGDAVFTTPFTFVATAEVISLVGATPIFVDINPRTFNMDAEKLFEILENFNSDLTPKGVVPVDLFGLPADYDAINNIAKQHGLFVLEDAAQGLGGVYKGRQAGSLADVAATSFFPAKPLGCYGDGGAIFTDNDKISESLRSIRVHGQGEDKYENIRIGVNGRLDTLQAAVLLAKLDLFPKEIIARQEVAARYIDGLKGLPGIETPAVPDGSQSVWAQYSLLVDRREDLREWLTKKGVPTAIYYPLPLHLQRAYLKLGYQPGDFPVAENASTRIMSLPMHPYMSAMVSSKIISEIVEWNQTSKGMKNERA